jgi:hypothetical protein
VAAGELSKDELKNKIREIATGMPVTDSPEEEIDENIEINLDENTEHVMDKTDYNTGENPENERDDEQEPGE